ncbi:hypothetical protein JAAARDRAFT_49224 [Jaapia argillacea MUCL 33604]|uniref:Uncharacterized protein n=1 Tax=Jaapia argillacea MUCL 33604 TaxID=933084 RepID=A0A067PLB1_9AGAM|nr:hypothetical protein JAAARDRAFT_49224 [Jaapia argillacea MUCL 33604]
MSLLCQLASSSNISFHSLSRATPKCLNAHTQTRPISSSPYGRTHVWKRRARKLPNPVVPQFPQKVIRADGSTFVHWTTSPRSLIRLARDLTNNPLWNSSLMKGESEEEESETSGRLGRFKRRFGSPQEGAMDWDGDWSSVTGDGDANAPPTPSSK